jgi:thiol-disulfide isomerase/thioredoxin
MKKLAYLFSVLILFACGNAENNDKQDTLEDNISINGSVQDGANMAIYLEALSQQGSIKVAEATTDANGHFELKGNVPGMGIYQLRLGESQDKVVPLTLSPNDKVTMKTTFNEFAVRPNVSGTEWAKPMNLYMEKYALFMGQQMQLNSLQGQLSEDEMMVKYLEIRKPLDDFSREQMNKDPDNPFNIILSTSSTPNMGFKDWDPTNLDVLKKVAEAYKKRYKDSPMAATMENQVFQIESAYNEFLNAGANPAQGPVAPEISMKDPNGKVLKLSSLHGKIVLIDFWASWCGPCRRESPNVVKLYKQYKDKGFTVFSVSLDDDAAAWKKAIAADGLIWPNHVSDLKGWETPMVQTYGISGIPHTVLIDKQGKIIATGLRGESLEQKLKELFAN